MLTPSFELSQNDTFLIIIIKARFAKVTETEVFVDGKDFKFYSKPYFLRLTLPGSVVEDGRESAKYDVDAGYFTIRIPKETPGEHFDGLDMLTRLLAPSGATSAKGPEVEIIDTEPTPGDNGAEDEDVEDIDWQLPQQPFESDEMTLSGSCYYGFANKRTGVFARLQDELCGIVDVPDPDNMTLSERREARLEAEQLKFDPDHYVADLMEDDCIQSVLEYITPWAEDYHKVIKEHGNEGKISSKKTIVKLTEEERDQLLKLTKKEYLFDEPTEASVMLGLVDIMFAYAYDIRTTEGEHSVESAWTVSKLSSTLSWLDWFTSIEEVLQACFTRGLTFPLYRHWTLNQQVLKDVSMIFHLGRKQLLKCLLDIHRTLALDEPHYVLNDLYITDYCVWVQSLSHAKIRTLAQAIDKIEVKKSEMTLDLEEIEHAALTMQNMHSIDATSCHDDTDSDDDSTSDNDSDDDDDDSSSDDDDDDDSSTDDDDDDSSSVDSDADSNPEEADKNDNAKQLITELPEEKFDSKTVYQYGYPHVLRDQGPNDSELKYNNESQCVEQGNNIVQEHGDPTCANGNQSGPKKDIHSLCTEPLCTESLCTDIGGDHYLDAEDGISDSEINTSLADRLMMSSPDGARTERGKLIEEINDDEKCRIDDRDNCDGKSRSDLEEKSSSAAENLTAADVTGLSAAVQRITLADSKKKSESYHGDNGGISITLSDSKENGELSTVDPPDAQSSDNHSNSCHGHNGVTSGNRSSDTHSNGCHGENDCISNRTVQTCSFENEHARTDKSAMATSDMGLKGNMDSTINENNQDLESWLKSPPTKKIDMYDQD